MDHRGRHLERIGDETTNIAEEMVYLVDGRVVRHGEPGKSAEDGV